MSADVRPGAAPTSVLGPRYRWISVGMCALVFLAAFESLAVTTVMPGISEALDGASLYALAFSGPLAVGIVGMVVAGQWSDRSGPLGSLLASLALFVAGLAIAGFAGSMEVLVAGRLLHGLGGGAMTVALYVMVARVYPADLHARIFAGFAAAWVVPSLVGPFLGGLVAEHLGWRWVFHGVILLVVPALAMLRTALRTLVADRAGTGARRRLRPLLWAAVAAVGVLVVDVASGAASVTGWLGAGAALVVTGVALRPLLPAGTLRARAGLPATIGVRGLLSAAFIGAEVYLPYLLTDAHHVSPVLAGFGLTFGGLAWALASQVHGRVAARVSDRAVLRLGTSLVLFAIAASALTSLLVLPPLVTVVVWTFAGAGMGLCYPRISTMVLALSSDGDRGFNSSALTIADSIGGAIALAGTGIVFGALDGGGPTTPFTGAFALATVLAAAAALMVRRGTAGRRAPRGAAGPSRRDPDGPTPPETDPDPGPSPVQVGLVA